MPKKLTDQERYFRAIPEAQLQEAQVRWARVHGWNAYWTWKSIHSPKGDPDVRYIRGLELLVVENKREDGTTTPEQEEALALWRTLSAAARGFKLEVWVVRPSSQDAFLDRLALPKYVAEES